MDTPNEQKASVELAPPAAETGAPCVQEATLDRDRLTEKLVRLTMQTTPEDLENIRTKIRASSLKIFDAMEEWKKNAFAAIGKLTDEERTFIRTGAEFAEAKYSDTRGMEYTHSVFTKKGTGAQETAQESEETVK